MGVFTEHLSQHLQTITPDLRGYGRSRTPSPFEMTDHLADLEALLDRYSLRRTVVLGWSLGGILALELALRRPCAVAGLILVASSAHPKGRHPPITWQDNVLTAIAALLNALFPAHPWLIEQWGRRSLFRYLVQQHTPQVYQRLAHEGVTAFWGTSKYATEALGRSLQHGYNRTNDLQAISCPVLMLAASADVHITPESSQDTALALPNCKLQIYENVAHLFPWEIPHQVLADIDQWLVAHQFGGTAFSHR